MGLNCCQYTRLDNVDPCRPQFVFTGHNLQTLTLRIQFNGVVREYEMISNSQGLVDFTTENPLIAGAHYKMEVLDSVGSNLGCYKFETNLIVS